MFFTINVETLDVNKTARGTRRLENPLSLRQAANLERLRSLEHPFIAKAEMATVADDDMVEHADAHNLANLL